MPGGVGGREPQGSPLSRSLNYCGFAARQLFFKCIESSTAIIEKALAFLDIEPLAACGSCEFGLKSSVFF